MISKAIVKNTLKELIRTRWAIPIGVIAIGIAILIGRYCIEDVLWGIYSIIIFGFSMLFTIGIIDSDISDGKIQTLLTKPISCAQFFLSKALGVIIFGSAIIIVMAISTLTIISVKGGTKIDVKIWLLLPLAGIIAHILWTLISSTFSTFIKGNGNVTMIILIGILLGTLSLIPAGKFKAVITFVGEYILPQPSAYLMWVRGGGDFLSSHLFHSLFCMVLCSIVGILVLNRRELGKR